MCADAHLARRKDKFLFQLILKADVTMVQETHGSRATLLATQGIAARHTVCASPADRHGAGGTMTVILAVLDTVGATPDAIRTTGIAPGRIHLTEVRCHDASLIRLSNIHN